MSVVKMTKEHFEAEVLKSEIPVIVEFWASWCGPCQAMAPLLEEISEEQAGQVKVCKINIDEERTLAAAYSVLAVPSVMVVKNGAITAASAGAKDKNELLEMLKK